MIEYKILALDGKNSLDYESQINNFAKGGWKMLGTIGKRNMQIIFSRDIKVEEPTTEA